MPPDRSYLGVATPRPRAAFFELASCEGCQLQLLNNEASLLPFLDLIKIVNFREIMTEQDDSYEIAFVEGSVTCAAEAEHLRLIRSRTTTLVAFGSCACFGGVNQLKNRFVDQAWVSHQVYGDHPVESALVQPLAAIVPVDLSIYGCPVNKNEVEQIVMNLVLGKPVRHPRYPVCMECKENENICLFDLNEPCLGPITRAGCNAWCPNNRAGCWGCRGPAEPANLPQLLRLMAERGIDPETVEDRLTCFGGFARPADAATDPATGAGVAGNAPGAARQSHTMAGDKKAAP